MPSGEYYPFRWDSLWRDLLFAARSMRLSPGFTAIAVLTLTLGIGATAAVFNIVSAALLRPLPYAEPDRLITVSGVKEAEGNDKWPLSYLDYVDLRQRARTLEGLAVRTEYRHFKFREPEGTAMVGGEMVSANYFQVLGVNAAQGRGFLPEEDRNPGGNRVAIISDALWRRAFGGSPDTLGGTVEVNGLPYSVVGIMPPGFRSSTGNIEIWLPISMATTISPTFLEDRSYRTLALVGRLRPSSTVEDAQKEISGLAQQLAGEYPDSNKDLGLRAMSLQEAVMGPVSPVLWTLLGGSALVLLISCTNIANLLLAKAVSRQREISLRVVLGAGRRRLIRQLLTESAFLGVLGCILGLLVASLCIGFMVQMSGSQEHGSELRNFVSKGLDPLALMVIVVVSILSGILFGLAPAIFASRTENKGLLTENGRNATEGTGSRRLQGMLIIGEVALAVALLLGVGLMAKTFWQQSRIDLGFKADHLLTMRLHTQSQTVATAESFRQVVGGMLERVQAVPGVASIAVSGPGMPTDEYFGLYFEVEGRNQDEPLLALRHHVSPGYFSTLGVSLLRGRVFTPQDTDQTTPVVVVSQTLAEQFWPGQNPIGKRLKAAPTPWLTVVGVVADVRQNGLSQQQWPAPDLYLPVLQLVPRTPPVLNLLVRTTAPPDTVAVTIQREIKRHAPDLPVYDIATMEARLSDQMASRRLLVVLMAFFSLAALLLAAVGIYGVTSYAVSQRTREFGIRLALGAQPKEVVWAALARGLGLALTGLSLGLIGGLILARLIKSQFVGADTLDPVVLASTVLVLLVITLAANYIPARRAVRADPIIALREQ